MSLFMEYEDAYNRDVDILFRECDIELSRYMHNYLYETVMDSLVTEGDDEKSKNKFSEFISKMINRVIRFIDDIIELITNTFSRKENIETGDFIGSKTGQDAIIKDMNRIQKEIDDEVLEGRTIIQKISRGLKVDASVVAKFADKCAKTVSEHGVAIASTAVGSALIARVAINNIKKNKKALKDTEKDSKECDNDKIKTDPITKVVTAITKVITSSTKLYSGYAKIDAKESKKKKK